MIQRLQSIYLFISALLLIAFAFTKFLIIKTGSEVLQLGVIFAGVDNHIAPNYLLTVLVSLIVIMTLITIFKYRNLANQLKLCALSIVLTVALIVSIAALAYSQVSAGEVSLTAYNLLPVGAFIFLIMAYKGIAHDKKLISDSERIR